VPKLQVKKASSVGKLDFRSGLSCLLDKAGIHYKVLNKSRGPAVHVRNETMVICLFTMHLILNYKGTESTS
jgi:tRNA U34 5-carboxymethylaminomethyl modifying enzyme MnmG/GidA